MEQNYELFPTKTYIRGWQRHLLLRSLLKGKKRTKKRKKEIRVKNAVITAEQAEGSERGEPTQTLKTVNTSTAKPVSLFKVWKTVILGAGRVSNTGIRAVKCPCPWPRAWQAAQRWRREKREICLVLFRFRFGCGGRGSLSFSFDSVTESNTAHYLACVCSEQVNWCFNHWSVHHCCYAVGSSYMCNKSPWKLPGKDVKIKVISHHDHEYILLFSHCCKVVDLSSVKWYNSWFF